MSIYISGALKGSRDISLARTLYEKAAHFVAEAGAEAFLPHSNTDPILAPNYSPEFVFSKDMTALKNALGMIAFLNEPSLGVGAELAVCLYEKIPVIGFARLDANVSRFAEGCLVSSGGRLIVYDHILDIRSPINSFVNECLQSRIMVPRASVR